MFFFFFFPIIYTWPGSKLHSVYPLRSLCLSVCTEKIQNSCLDRRMSLLRSLSLSAQRKFKTLSMRRLMRPLSHRQWTPPVSETNTCWISQAYSSLPLSYTYTKLIVCDCVYGRKAYARGSVLWLWWWTFWFEGYFHIYRSFLQSM